MEDQFMPELSRIERQRMLEANADGILEKYAYDRKLTDDELAEYRTEYALRSIEISEKQDELDELSRSLRSEIKTLKNFCGQKLNEIKWRRVSTVETVYQIADHQTGLMMTYNTDGQLIEKRALRPQERQTRIPMWRTGTDD